MFRIWFTLPSVLLTSSPSLLYDPFRENNIFSSLHILNPPIGKDCAIPRGIASICKQGNYYVAGYYKSLVFISRSTPRKQCLQSILISYWQLPDSDYLFNDKNLSRIPNYQSQTLMDEQKRGRFSVECLLLCPLWLNLLQCENCNFSFDSMRFASLWCEDKKDNDKSDAPRKSGHRKGLNLDCETLIVLFRAAGQFINFTQKLKESLCQFYPWAR